MKAKDITKYSTQELVKTKKSKNLATWLLAIVVLLLLLVNAYKFHQTRAFNSLMTIPIVFLPIIIAEFVKLQKISAELERRNINGEGN